MNVSFTHSPTLNVSGAHDRVYFVPPPFGPIIIMKETGDSVFKGAAAAAFFAVGVV
jgi:hypothetical protein